MYPAVFGFYGLSNTGKTTLIANIIQKLTMAGYKVATIKYSDKNIGIDMEQKDTCKLSQAGSVLVVFSSPIETDFIVKQGKNISQILNHINSFGCFDIVLVEGAHDSDIPKIRLGDIVQRKNTLGTYNGDINKIIEMIKKEIKKKQRIIEENVHIKVNGKPIHLTKFPLSFSKKTIVGMLNSLKGIGFDKINKVEIRFET